MVSLATFVPSLASQTLTGLKSGMSYTFRMAAKDICASGSQQLALERMEHRRADVGLISTKALAALLARRSCRGITSRG